MSLDLRTAAGTIDFEELKQAVTEDLQSQIAVQDLEDLYSTLDQDGDGKVDFAEFHGAIRALGCVVDGVAGDESEATRWQRWRQRVW